MSSGRTNLPQPAPGPEQPSFRLFRRIATAATALGFAAVLGSVACVQPAEGQGLEFQWHWFAVLWILLGAAAGWRLWHLLWRAQTDPRPAARRALVRYGIVLAVGGLLVFAYPFRFVAPQKFRDVLTGLGAAALVLAFVGWMLYRLVKSLARDQD